MHRPKYKILILVCLACVTILKIFNFQVQFLIQNRTQYKKSALSSEVILVKGETEICIHHPEGCPKSCLCPKIKLTPDSIDEKGFVGSRILHEPNLNTWLLFA